MTAAQLREAPGGFLLEGEVGFSTVTALWQDSARLLAGGGPVCVDLVGVTRTDSAGLALLIHWVREVRHGGGIIEFANMPAQMRAMARVSGVDRVLPLRDAPAGDEGPGAATDDDD